MSIKLPTNRYANLENFGHSLSAASYVYRPGNAEEISVILKFARENGLTVTVRGAGRSYNDAALNGGGIVLDMKRFDHILEWDPASGLVKAEPGVCLRQLWQHTLADGWWPPVVSGTMTTTLGGCLAVNIHGKNNFRMGPIGEHVVEFTALLPTGAEVTCSPGHNGDLFRAMISGLGMLGVFTSVTLQMKKVYSGLLNVHAWPVRDLRTHLDCILESAPAHNYTVGWLDATARGKSLGRGQLHTADYLEEGDDRDAQRTLKVEYQTLPDKFFGSGSQIHPALFHGAIRDKPGLVGRKYGQVRGGAAESRVPPVACRLPLFARLRSRLGVGVRPRRVDPVPVLPAQGDRPGCLDRDAGAFSAARAAILPGRDQAPSPG